MKSTARTIRCPACGSGIPVEIDRLIEGAAFGCPMCKAGISIAPESREVARRALAAIRAVGSRAANVPASPTGLVVPRGRRN